jgi:hypothetical protein
MAVALMLSSLRTTSSTSTSFFFASAFFSGARLFSSSSSSTSSPPKTKKRASSKTAAKAAKPLSGAARRSLALYRGALRASRQQPTPKAREALAQTARSRMEAGRKVDPQTAEHLQRRGARQLELVRSGAAVLGTVSV